MGLGNAINTSWDNKSYPTFISGLGVFDLYLNTENLMAISEAILYCTFYMIFASMPCAFICQGGHKLRLQITDVVSVNTWLIRDIKETLSSLLSISSEAGSFSPFPPKQQIMKCVLVLWVFFWSTPQIQFSWHTEGLCEPLSWTDLLQLSHILTYVRLSNWFSVK